MANGPQQAQSPSNLHEQKPLQDEQKKYHQLYISRHIAGVLTGTAVQMWLSRK